MPPSSNNGQEHTRRTEIAPELLAILVVLVAAGYVFIAVEVLRNATPPRPAPTAPGKDRREAPAQPTLRRSERRRQRHPWVVKVRIVRRVVVRHVWRFLRRT